MSIAAKPWEGGGSASVPDASETTKGKIRIATSSEAATGTDDLTAMTPLTVKERIDASLVGGVEYKGTWNATAGTPPLLNAEQGDLYVINVAGTIYGQDWSIGDQLLINADMGGTITNSKINKVDNTDTPASETVAGVIEIATDLEAGAGTETDKALVPSNVSSLSIASSQVTGLATVATSGAYADVTGTPTLATVATTGAYADVTGTPTLATVATTGAYADVTGTPTLATVATTGAYADVTGTPTLGTAAAQDVGEDANDVVQLDASARLPAVDGSQLTNLPSGATQLNDLSDVTITGATTGEVLRYSGAAWVDATLAYADISGTPTLATVATTGAYADVTGTPTLATVATTGAYADVTGTPTLATVATTGAYADVTGTPTLGTAAAQDVGEDANDVVQLDASARLPAVDGSQLTNLPSGATQLNDLSDVTITGASTGEVLRYSGAAWVDATLAYADISGTPTLATVATTGAYADVTGTPTLATVATTGAYADVTGTPTLATVATTGAYADVTGTPTLGTAAAQDVGEDANDVVQLDASARLPAVDGSLLTNLPSGATQLNDLSDVSITGAATGEVLRYSGAAWVDATLAYADISGTPTLATVATTGAYADLSGTPTTATETTEGVIELATNAEAQAASATDKALVPSNIGSIDTGDLNDDGTFLKDLSEDTTPQLGGNLDVNGNLINSVSNGDIEVAPNGTGSFKVQGNATSGSGRIVLNCEQNSHGITLKGPPHSAAADYTLTFPNTDGSADQVLKTDGSGVLDWVDQSGGGGGGATLNQETLTADKTISTPSASRTIFVFTSSADRAINLPSASGLTSGQLVDIKSMSNVTFTVTPNGTDKLDGSAGGTLALNVQFSSITLVCDGSDDWFIV